MTTISLDEFRQGADSVILIVRKGESVVVTDDGKPVVRITPIPPIANEQSAVPASDPLRWMCRLGERQPGQESNSDRDSLTNEDIDRIVYGL